MRRERASLGCESSSRTISFLSAFQAVATLGDVADWVASLAKLHDSPLVAVDVKMPRRAAPSIASTGVSHGTH